MTEGPQRRDHGGVPTEPEIGVTSDMANEFLPPPPPPPPGSGPATPSAPAATPFQPGYTAPSAPPAPLPGIPVLPSVAPGMAAAASPAAPSPFVMALKNLWSVMNTIWRGRLSEAFEPAAEAARVTGSKWVNWFVPLLATSISGAIFFLAWASNLVRGALSASGLGLFMPTGPYLEFSDYVQMFLLFGLVVFGVLALRAVAVMFAVRVTGGNVSFPDAATVLGVGQTLMWLPLLVGVLLTFILGITPLTVLLAVGLSGVGLMAELVTYVGVTRMGQFKYSPLVPYAWFTMLAYVVAFLVIYMISSAIVG